MGVMGQNNLPDLRFFLCDTHKTITQAHTQRYIYIFSKHTTSGGLKSITFSF